MKKVYMMPFTRFVEAQTEEMIAASDMFTESGSGDLSQDLSTPQTTTDTSGNLSRQGLWEDEE